jgi:hypothetical protein
MDYATSARTKTRTRTWWKFLFILKLVIRLLILKVIVGWATMAVLARLVPWVIAF